MLTLCHNYFRVTPNNKNNKDDVQTFSKRKFAFGLFILFLVSLLWVVSSELTMVPPIFKTVFWKYTHYKNLIFNKKILFSVYIQRKKTRKAFSSDLCEEFLIVHIFISIMFHSTNKRSLPASRLHSKTF